ncbi:MAG: methyltransferase [Defluviitaleaceae bacterium]|nr:methyltransferase [Defluviitaleaceae bacterium]
MPQYFEYDSSLKRNYKRISCAYGSHNFTFLTCDGVFSKDEVDPYSLALLNCAEELDISGEVLDLGCGYGAIGVIAAKIFPIAALWQSDVNQTAVELAIENARLNGVESRVVLSDGYEKIGGLTLFDWVFLNPPIHAGKECVYRLFAETKEHLKGCGKLLVVIHKKHGAESAMKELHEVFGEVCIVRKKKGLYIMMCGKTEH